MKLDFIKLYYGIGSIVEDKKWGTEYKVCEIRGPYWRIRSEIFEKEMEIKVVGIEFKEEIIIENIPVKFYAEDKFRFDIGGFLDEIRFLDDYIEQQNYHDMMQIKESLDKLYFMCGTNLMRYSDLAKIKESIEEFIAREELERFFMYRFLSEILEQYTKNTMHSATIINNGGQVNFARDKRKSKGNTKCE